MSDPFVRPKTRIIYGILATVGLATTGLAILSFRNYNQSVSLSGGGAPISIFIQNPQPGSKFELNELVILHAVASGPSPVVAIEFYADGDLADYEVAPTDEGLLQFQADFLWYGEQLGPHGFYVRAIGVHGETQISPTLILEVSEEGTLTPQDSIGNYVPPGLKVPVSYLAQKHPGGAPYYGLPQDGAGSGEPAYQPVGVPEGLPAGAPNPSDPWSPSLGGWMEFLFSNDIPIKPPAPVIAVVTVDNCRPLLWIADKASNEDGFYVYRRGPGVSTFLKIATLGPNDSPSFVFDDDPVILGLYEYYLSAFNQAGEAPSNIKTVEVFSPSCLPQEEPGLVLDLASLFEGTAADKGYCYGSTDGENWIRYPHSVGTFFDVDGAEPGSINPEMISLDLIGAGGGGDMTLDLECWSWAESLIKIGTFHYENLVEAATVSLQPIPGLVNPQLIPDPSKVPSIAILGDFRVPIPQLWLGSGPQACANHAGGNLFFILVCADIADDIDFAYWGLGECLGESCFDSSEIVGYNVYDSWFHKGKSPVQTTNAPISLYFMINDKYCSARHLRVTALVEHEGKTFESFPSNTVYYEGNPNCGFLMGTTMHGYILTLDSLDFSIGNIDDGIDLKDRAEGYGLVRVWTENGDWTRFMMGDQMWHFIYFGDNEDENPYYFRDFDFHEIEIIKVTCYAYCEVESSWNSPPTDVMTDFLLYRGQWVMVDIWLWDRDFDKDNKPTGGVQGIANRICVPPNPFWFSSNMVEEAPNQVIYGTLYGYNESGDCKFDFHIELAK